jgi:hypothetical protein
MDPKRTDANCTQMQSGRLSCGKSEKGFNAPMPSKAWGAALAYKDYRKHKQKQKPKSSSWSQVGALQKRTWWNSKHLKSEHCKEVHMKLQPQAQVEHSANVQVGAPWRAVVGVTHWYGCGRVVGDHLL